MPTAFGAKIKEYCNLVGSNLKGLAGDLGVQQPQLSQWLKGKNDNDANPPKISRQNAKLIIQALTQRGAITTLDQAHELLELAFPDQTILHKFTEMEQEESWYITLSQKTKAALVQPSASTKYNQNPNVSSSSSSISTATKKKTARLSLARDAAALDNAIVKPITPLLGRDKELKACIAALKSKETRLLTLMGPGGIGKTRLAQELARELVERGIYPDGIAYFGLDTLNFGHEIAPLLCEAFGLVAVDKDEAEYNRLLVNFLRSNHTLLMLDNFEQLIDEVSLKLLAILLGKTQDLRILATSRERLGFLGEQIFELEGLPLPPADIDRKNAEALLKYGAIELFVWHAKNNKRGFIFDHENCEAVAQLCERLDGMPLALELAGTLMRHYTVQDLLEAESSPLFDESRSILNALPPRQRNLIVLLDWSYHKLTEQEKLLLLQLSVFIGGCTLEAASEICLLSLSLTEEGHAASPQPAASATSGSSAATSRVKTRQKIAGLLDRLADKSLVKIQPDNQRRYTMLWTIKEYARLTLEATAGEHVINQLKERHADYYLRLAKEAEPYINQQASQEWLVRLKKEYGNLLGGLDYYITQGKTAKAYDMAAALGSYWYRSQTFAEGVKWVDATLQLANLGEIPPMITQAELLFQAGRLHNNFGNYERASKLFNIAKDFWIELNDKQKLCLTLTGLGNIAYRLRSYDEANRIYLELNQIAEQEGDEYTRSVALSNLGNNALTQERHAEAKIYLERCLPLVRKLNNEPSIARIVKNLGQIYSREKNYEIAHKLYTESLDIYNKLNHKKQVAEVILFLSKTEYLLGNYQTFLIQTLDASRIVQTHNVTSYLGYCFLNFALSFGIIIKDAEQAVGILNLFDTIPQLSADLDKEDKILLNGVRELLGLTGSTASFTFHALDNDGDISEDEAEKCWTLLDTLIKVLQGYGSRWRLEDETNQ